LRFAGCPGRGHIGSSFFIPPAAFGTWKQLLAYWLDLALAVFLIQVSTSGCQAPLNDGAFLKVKTI
jgi:hypothetical protein